MSPETMVVGMLLIGAAVALRGMMSASSDKDGSDCAVSISKVAAEVMTVVAALVEPSGATSCGFARPAT